jgi:kynurenine formamidase
MKIIDLSQPLYDRMDVYPRDPKVKIKQVHHLSKEGWRLKYLQFSSHIGTHVDAFAHMDRDGKTIDEIPINRFIGKTVVVKINQSLPKGVGLAFKEGKIGTKHLEKIKKAKPLFVLAGNEAVLEVELERGLLKAGVITMTDLVNMEKLPSNKSFMFYGVPLKIRKGDGSPIRAFAVLD